MIVTIKKEVDIFTLDGEDLLDLSKETLVDAILEAGELLKAAKTDVLHCLEDTSQRGAKDCCEDDIAMPGTQLAFDVATKAAGCNAVHHGGGPIGRKHGTTSKFHYVYFSRTEGLWRSGLTIKRAYHNTYSGLNEIDAALAIDEFLDSINDSKRPRNRDDHEEVMDAYNRLQ